MWRHLPFDHWPPVPAWRHLSRLSDCLSTHWSEIFIWRCNCTVEKNNRLHLLIWSCHSGFKEATTSCSSSPSEKLWIYNGSEIISGASNSTTNIRKSAIKYWPPATCDDVKVVSGELKSPMRANRQGHLALLCCLQIVVHNYQLSIINYFYYHYYLILWVRTASATWLSSVACKPWFTICFCSTYQQLKSQLQRSHERR